MYTKEELIKKGLAYYKRGNNTKSTIEELAFELKVSKVTLYNNFGSKKNYQNQIVKSLLLKIRDELENLVDIKRPVYKKIITFFNIVTDFYSSDEYKVVLGLSHETKSISNEKNEFELLYKQVLLSLIKDGQEKELIDERIEPLHLFYLVDMGLKYFSQNSDYKIDIASSRKLNNFIISTFTSAIFNDNQGFLKYSRDKEKQENDNLIEYYMELANIGTKKSVDIMMDELERSKTVVETRFIDFGLSLVAKEEAFKHIHWYLFNGTQIQRNYATLYFVRQGRYDFVREAYDLGLIDKKQAFSR